MFKNKKLIVTMLFLALILVVAACGGNDKGSSGSGTGDDSGSESTDDSGGESTAQGDVDNGAKVFENNCMSCHGKEGAGGGGPTLQGDDFATNYDKVVKLVKNGGGGMPAFGEQLSEQEIADVSTYITEEIAPMGK